jgi:hypothetical protein
MEAARAQRLYDVLFNLSIRGSAWLTRSVRHKKDYEHASFPFRLERLRRGIA